MVEGSVLELELLGAPVISVDRAPLVVDTRKAVGLLAYLAVTGRPQTRDTLADLFWPDSPVDRGRAALRRTLSVVGKALSSRWLVADRSQITLTTQGVRSDVAEFRRHLDACLEHGHPPTSVCPACREPLDAAVRLHRAAFLAGFRLRDADPFNAWADLEAESLHRELAGALDRVVRAHVLAGALDDALPHAERAVTLDPLDEQAHRRLMLLHNWAGRRGEAIRQFRACVAVLGRELGVEPLDETRALHQAILEGRAPEPPRPEEPPMPVAAPKRRAPRPPLDRPPLVDRSDELKTIREALAGTGAALVVLRGEAGIGKTRLIEEVVAGVEAAGAPTLVARCHEDERELALGPVAALLRAFARHRAQPELPAWVLAEVGRLVPSLAEGRDLPAPAPLDTPGARTRLLDAVATALTASVWPDGLLVLDDVHAADASSAELLGYLARRLDEHPVRLLVAARPEELGREHPVERALAGAGAQATQVTLGRLDPDDVERLVAAVSPHLGAGATRIVEEADGLPLFAVELARAAPSDAGDTWVLPATIREALRHRIGRVSDLSRQLLTATAVLGGTPDGLLIQDVSGRTEDETTVALDELVAAGLLVEQTSGATGYALGHQRLRDVLLEDASPARRRVLHRRAAEALATRGAAEGAGASSLARHLTEAGDARAGAAAHRAAAHHARRLGAINEAIEHLEHALALDTTAATEVHLTLAELLKLDGRYDESQAALERAAASAGDDRPTVATIERRLAQLALRRGRIDLAAAHLDAASALDPDAPALERAARDADRALLEVRRDDLAAAEEAIGRALTAAEEAENDVVLAEVHNLLGLLARRRGDAADGSAHLQVSLAHAARLTDPGPRIAALNNLALMLGDEGRSAEAIDRAEEALTLCRRLGDRHRLAALHSNLADLLHASGRTDEALPHLTESALLFAAVDGARAHDPQVWRLTDW